MKESIPVAYCKNLFYTKGRNEKLKLLEESNLTDREIKILKMRYIEGLSLKENVFSTSDGRRCFEKISEKSLSQIL